jgi:hypothetical protein
MLVWDETDVLACLEAEPETGPDATWHQYTLKKDGLRLELLIYRYDGDVYLDLYRDGVERSVFSMQIPECPGIRYVGNANGEYLEIAATNSLGERYDGESAIPSGVRLWANPAIRIELFGRPSIS